MTTGQNLGHGNSAALFNWRAKTSKQHVREITFVMTTGCDAATTCSYSQV